MTAAPSSPDLPLKQRLKNGHVPVGTMVFEFFVPGMAQMTRAVGADFLMYDTEHSGVDIEAIKAQCAACNGTGVVPLVRVPGFHYHFVARALDAGAHGIMMPMVADAEQARALVSWSRYPPLGRRGAAFGVAHDGYLPGPSLPWPGLSHVCLRLGFPTFPARPGRRHRRRAGSGVTPKCLSRSTHPFAYWTEECFVAMARRGLLDNAPRRDSKLGAPAADQRCDDAHCAGAFAQVTDRQVEVL